MSRKHVLSVLLENESGALSRVSGLFSARGYNIESLSVAPTDDPSLSRMTLVTSGTAEMIEQIIKQLNKLIDVVKLIDLADAPAMERELMLIKVKATNLEEREEMMRMSQIFRGRIIDVAASSYVIELTGDTNKLEAFIKALDPVRIIEVVRSGSIGMSRGQHSLQV